MIPGLYTLSELQQAIAHTPDQWRPLVLTNGCFDLLHAGHVRYLRQAQSLGRSLVVGLNSDRSVQALKSQPNSVPRPIIPELQRAEVIAALKPVDGVVIFSEITASALIQALQPEIYVKGGDYQLHTLPEASIVQAYGGEIQLINIEVPSSSSKIIDRIRQTVQQPNN